MWTVMVQPVRPEPDLHTLHPHVDPLDLKLHDPSLLALDVAGNAASG